MIPDLLYVILNNITILKRLLINVKIKIKWVIDLGKTAASIKLIQILSAKNDFISTEELAEILGINKRNIREYIAEIEEAGYFVESKRGLTGGYRILNHSTLPQAKLTEDEKFALEEAYEFMKQNEYPFIEDFTSATNKFLVSKNYKDDLSPEIIIEKYPLAIDKKELMDKYQTIANAIEDQYKCELLYTSSKNETKRHIIHPYKLFCYNGGWFVLAYDEDKNDFAYYKLNRMDAVYKKKNHFTKMDFNESDYLDEFGMKNNGEYYTIELEFKDLNIYIQERIYGKNQSIEVIDDNHLKLTCDMQNKDMILSFVLSFGNKCKVLSPDWLKEDVTNEILKMMDNYD